MQTISHEKFFNGYREAFGSMTQQQVGGLNFILASLEADDHITDIRHAAYMLATVKHETANTFQPIKEYGEGKAYKYGKVDGVTGKTYFGRGFVQITWKENYQTFGKVLGVDLINTPDLALDPAVAYRIMSYGMRTGAFTGVSMSRYIHGDTCQYESARKVINGTDCSERIANYALKFEHVLKAAC